MNWVTFGRNISVELIRREMTQKQLANQIGIHPESLSRYCTGKREPRISWVYKIAKALGCTIDSLLEGCDED